MSERCEQLALFDAADAALEIGDNVKVRWNAADLPYIQKNFPQRLTTGIVMREKFSSYDVRFGDDTAYLVDKELLTKI